jgi:hypothetical protein
MPISGNLGIMNDQCLLLFYLINAFSNDIYFLDREDAIAVLKKEGGILHIFDVISKTAINFNNILSQIITADVKKVVFHFTPDIDGIDINCEPSQNDDTLFIRPVPADLTRDFLFPETSHT